MSDSAIPRMQYLSKTAESKTMHMTGNEKTLPAKPLADPAAGRERSFFNWETVATVLAIPCC